jgi:hypothetical protein
VRHQQGEDLAEKGYEQGQVGEISSREQGDKMATKACLRGCHLSGLYYEFSVVKDHLMTSELTIVDEDIV